MSSIKLDDITKYQLLERSDLILFLQHELRRILTERAQAHVSSCKNPTKCDFPRQPGTKPGWLAQGSFNIVFCDSKDRQKVYRFGFFTYDSENHAKERVDWNKAMRNLGIGVCNGTRYQKFSTKDQAMNTFEEKLRIAFIYIIKDTELELHCSEQCYATLAEERDEIIEKASRALDRCKERVGHSIYLFCEESSYAPEGDLGVFLLAGGREQEERIAAWKAAYDTVTKYTKFFEKRLRSRDLRRCDAVLVDLKPPNFLVYKDPSNNVVRVVFGDAGLYELDINASASELSLRSLQLLSGLDGKGKESLCTQLSLGVFATLLANGSQGFASTGEEAFEDGIQILQDELARLTSGASQQDQDLLKKAIALTANLLFPIESRYRSFLDFAAQYVLGNRSDKRLWAHSRSLGAAGSDFQALHDYALTPRAAEMTAAAEQYTALLYKVFACRKCSKPNSSTRRSIKELLAELKAPYDKHAVPNWLAKEPFASSALVHYNTAKPQQGFQSSGNWPAYPVVFYDDGKESKRLNVVTFFFIPADNSGCCRKYLAWKEFLCSYKIGASETRSFCEVKPPAPTNNSSSNKRWFLFCHTQPDDEGVLADIFVTGGGEDFRSDTRVRVIAAKAWIQLFGLMYRYAHALLQWSQSTTKEAEKVPFFYFGTWDPTYVAVYSYMFGNGPVVRARLLEPRLLVQLQGRGFRSVPRTKLAEELPTQEPSELAGIFYLSLLANGAGQNCLSTKAACFMALSPLRKALRRPGVDWQKTLGAAHKVAAKLGLATAGGLRLLSNVSTAYNSATVERSLELVLANLLQASSS